MSNSTTILGSNIIFTNRSGESNVVLQAGNNETLLLKNTSLDLPNIVLQGGISSGTFSNGVNTKITNSLLNTSQAINANSADMTWDSTNSQFVLNRIGSTYLVEAYVSWAVNTSNSREISFQVNGNQKNAVRMMSASGTGQTQLVSSLIIPAISAQTTVSLWGNQDSGGSLTLGTLGCIFSCYRLG